MVGVNRILRGLSIPCVLGDSNLDSDQEKQLRRKYIIKSIDILMTKIEDPTVFFADKKGSSPDYGKVNQK